MSSFLPRFLSDEDIAYLFNLCSNADLSLVRQKDGAQKWRCRVCGQEFPASRTRQPEGEHLCLADYVSPVGGPLDVIALQVVTMGPGSSEKCEALNKQGLYAEAYYLHGLSVEAAEGLAEVAHQHIRAELGLGEGGGKRYSWGYPAIPDLADHGKVWSITPSRCNTPAISRSPFLLSISTLRSRSSGPGASSLRFPK